MMRVLKTEKEAKEKGNRGERRRRIRYKTQVMNIRGERREKGRTEKKGQRAERGLLDLALSYLSLHLFVLLTSNTS